MTENRFMGRKMIFGAGLAFFILIAGCSKSDVAESSDAPATAIADVEANLAEVSVSKHVEAPDGAVQEHDHDHEHHHDHNADASLGAHVHGEGEFVVVKTSTGIIANFISPLVSVGLKPSFDDIDALPRAISHNFIVIEPANTCSPTQSKPIIQIERVGDHGDIDIEREYVCTDVLGIESITLSLFDHTDALEKVEAILIDSEQQSTYTLTKAEPTILFE